MKKIFFAYESGHQENKDAIIKGIEQFNSHQSSYYASSWEELRIGGKIIDKTIFKSIDNCEIFSCDLSYLNHNVLFELAYAIAKSKKLQIFLNPTINNSRKNYSEIKILKNVGYVEFQNAKDILKGLQQKLKIDTILINQILNIDSIKKDENEIFLINNSLNSQASLDIESNINKLNYKNIISKPSEVVYQTLAWFIKNIISSKIIIVHLVSYEKVDYFKLNSELSFYAGIAIGLGKEVILVAPKPYKAPIDYSDILIEYDDADDCVLKTLNFIEYIQRKNNEFIEKKLEEIKIIKNDTEDLNLLKLGIGFETAEDEEKELLNYFVEIDAYNHALKRKSTILVGRKGSGKTALFYKLKNELDSEINFYNVILKPDSEELLENIDFSRLYSSESSKKTFLFSVWKYLLLSKIFISIIDKIKANSLVSQNTQNKELLDYYNSNEKLLSLNFYGVLLSIYKKNESNKIFENPKLLEQFYIEVYKPLHNLLIQYFTKKKYIKIIILADNLDKTWETKNDLSLQSEMILTFLEFINKIPKELNNEFIEICSLIFLRKDIFDYIKLEAREPDKLITKSVEIDWRNHKEKLQELIEKRFKYSLNLNESYDINQIWSKYFKLNKNEKPYDLIKEIVVCRPRDMIYFVSKLFESAINSNKKNINENDFTYAIEAYTKFLHGNLIAELKAEYPEIEDIMNQIQNKFYGFFFDYKKFLNLLDKYKYDNNKKKKFITTLFKNDYIVGLTNKDIIKSYDNLEDFFNKKRFFFFKKYNIKILLHPDSYIVRSSAIKLFKKLL